MSPHVAILGPSGFAGRAFLFMLLLALPGWALAEDLPTDRAHAFYYGWYGNPGTDGAWRQWNHPVAARTPEQEHTCVPPHDIGANFYPERGLYSANNPDTLADQMAELRAAGVGVVALSWWGKDKFTDKNVPRLLDAAQQQGLEVCFHIEPFGGRNAATFREALAYLIESYGDHPALYRVPSKDNRPLVYVYDSYLTPATEWAEVLTPEGKNTIRATALDTVVIGLWVKNGDGVFMRRGGFDGFYTYFASDGFTYGSTWANWPALAAYADQHDLLFIPSVAPGYEDRKIRPWNGRNTRERENGAYYDNAFKAAIDANPDMISITSYNEWHEGTQIEPAIPYDAEGVTYLDYGEREPDWYLHQTRHWIQEYTKTTQTND